MCNVCVCLGGGLENSNLRQFPLQSLAKIFRILSKDANFTGVGADQEMALLFGHVDRSDGAGDGAVIGIVQILHEAIQDRLQTSPRTVIRQFQRVDL
jgi:hypothetical protein